MSNQKQDPIIFGAEAEAEGGCATSFGYGVLSLSAVMSTTLGSFNVADAPHSLILGKFGLSREGEDGVLVLSASPANWVKLFPDGRIKKGPGFDQPKILEAVKACFVEYMLGDPPPPEKSG